MTYAQRAIWRAEQVWPGSALHNESAAFSLSGALDADRLVRALTEVTGRHEALRSRIADGPDSEPVQLFSDTVHAAVERIDLTNLPGPERERRLVQLIIHATTTPFELTLAPLIRIQLIRLAAQDHVLLFAAHHIAVDAWALGVFLDEVAARYTTPFGAAIEVPGIGNYATWQRGEFDAGRHLAYWRGRLGEKPPAVDFPAAPGGAADSPPGGRDHIVGRLHQCTVPADLAAGLAQLGRTELASLSTVLLTAFCTVVGRRTGRDSLNVGMPVATRSRPGLAGVVGPLLNVMVHRAHLPGQLTFREALRRTRAALKEDLRHRDTPLDLVLQHLDSGTESLFQVMYAFHSGPTTTLELPDIHTVPLPTHSGTAKHDLSLFVRPRPSGTLDLSLEYRAATLDSETVDDLARSLLCLLHEVVEDAERSLAELPLLTPQERRRIPEDCDTCSQEKPLWDAVPQVLRELALQDGTALAVRSRGTALTRAAADADADRVAARLAARYGIEPGDRVALRTRRDAGIVPLMVGVWRAGAVLVPLDEALPPERVTYMIGDSDAKAVITDGQADGGAPGDLGKALRLSAATLLAEGEDGRVPYPDGPAPDELAYLMYTSGSTGTPKGVAVSHGNLANLLHSIAREPGITTDDVLLAVTSVGFDISMLELFAPLTAGGQVVIAPRETVRDADALAALLTNSGATLMQATPSLWRALLDGAAPPRQPGLRVFSGGELLDRDLADLLLDWCDEVWNLYGPTETTVWSTVGRVRKGEPVTVGRAVARTVCYLLGRDNQPVRPGSIGEVVIGGAGVSAGYWNRPALTAAAFVDDPVNPHGGGVYRTGDLGRRLPDGRLVILGRADGQLKILGHRIELREIEAVLARHPAVRNAAVVADRADRETPRLAAFVATGTDTDEAEAATALRAWLRRHLPAAVVPGTLVVLPELPLNTSGKIDRRALVHLARTATSPSGTEPVSRLERTVADLWAAVLGTAPDRVRMADDFLAAGGNSLGATRLLALVREALGTAPSLAAFYQDPTPAALARTAADAVHPEPRRAAADIPPGDPVPLTDQQRQLWLLHRLNPDSPAYNLAAAVHLDGPVDTGALHAALSDLAARHPILTARCDLHDAQPVWWPRPHARVPLSEPDVPRASGDAQTVRDAVAALARAEAARPFDLSAGPLMRVGVVHLPDGRDVLLLCAHHLAVDGWSVGVLLRDLTTLYAHRTGTGSAPSPASAGLAGYAAVAAGEAGEAARAKQLAYWTARLKGYPGVLHLPTEVARTEDRPLPVAIPHELTTRLRQTASELRVTPFALLLTAFGALLGRYTGSDDVVVGVPVANRDRTELDSVVGSLANLLPVRLDVSGPDTFAELATRTARAFARDLDHPLVPLDQLVSLLGLDRSSGRTPLVQAMLTLQEAPPAELTLGHVRGRVEPLHPGTAKYEIALSLDEHADRLDGHLDFPGNRFGPGSANRFMTHLSALLTAGLADPRRSLDTVDLTDGVQPSPRPAHPHAAARRDHPLPVHEVFRRRARLDPRAVAVRHEGAAVDYGSLDAWSDHIAGGLAEPGAAPGRFVALLLPTGPVQTAVALGVAKAGLAFCALAPGDPGPRLTALLADADPVRVLATREALTAHPDLWDPVHRRFGGVRVELVRESAPAPGHGAPPAAPAPQREVSGGDPLCLVYTSGSTGVPKGIVLPHATFTQLAAWEREYYGIKPGGRIAQWAPFTYDAAYSDMFATLCAGATLCIAPEDRRRDPLAVAEWLRAERITRLGTVPGFFHLITEALETTETGLPDLEHVQLAGEAVPPRLVQAWAQRPDRPRLHNLYGPTECVIATYRELGRAETFADSVPIGVAIPGREVLVLDHRGRPCPVGVPGEIHLRSDFLAGAYHRRPEESARAYIPDPWQPGGTLYRTGDIGRWTADGELTFCGRIGSQVKIRGSRVELEGIEAVLESHPLVREAAAAVHQVGGTQRLVGYAITTPGVDGEELRAHLAARLPAPAVPDTVMILPTLPRTRSNKRDRARLPLPEAPAARGSAPLAGLEQLVADAWREVLGGATVGRHTNFFEAGGDSLRAARLQLELNRLLGRQIPLVDVFARPTIAQFAAGLDATGAAPSGKDSGEPRGERRRAAMCARAEGWGRTRGPVGDTDGPTRKPTGSS